MTPAGPEMAIASEQRVQAHDFGSLIKNP